MLQKAESSHFAKWKYMERMVRKLLVGEPTFISLNYFDGVLTKN